MTIAQSKTLSVFAPAKLNLYLHITGRRDNGYHELDSLMAFADIGDQIKLVPASDFAFEVKGPYAGAFTAKEKDASPNSSNLVVRAVWALARLLHRDPDIKVILTKNLPVASGLGGGSSDAAAILWALAEWWRVQPQALPGFDELMIELGADVPACFRCRPVKVGGIGEVLEPLPVTLPEWPVVLVNPGRFCRTVDVFRLFNAPFSAPAVLPENLQDQDAFLAFLQAQDNMLTAPALEVVPEIGMVLDVLQAQEGCHLARMSGSGASCFALFAQPEQALEAAEAVMMAQPRWWVRSGILNRPERY